MSRKLIIGGVVGVFILAAIILPKLYGTGYLVRFFTLGGFYSVHRIDGYAVVCFGEKGVPGISCLPEKDVKP